MPIIKSALVCVGKISFLSGEWNNNMLSLWISLSFSTFIFYSFSTHRFASCLICSRASCVLCLACALLLYASLVLRVLAPYVPLLLCVSRVSYVNLNVCPLMFPCLMRILFYSFPTGELFQEIYYS